MNNLLGDTVGRTLIKLAVISVLVGMVMSVFGWTPLSIFNAMGEFFANLWAQGFAALGRFGDWLILGASVVIPVFIILRVLSYRKG
ncbi:MAG: DUF6460 domain-containing protein [Pseudomonadota bacterium]